MSEANLSVLLAAAAGAVTSVLAETGQSCPYLANINVSTAIHQTRSSYLGIPGSSRPSDHAEVCSVLVAAVAADVVVAVAVVVRGWGEVAGEPVVVVERSCYRRAPGSPVQHC